MILCAAIHVTFTRSGKEVETIIPGFRHSSCWELMAALGVPTERKETEGFIDHNGQFLDRYDAYERALMCGQISETTLVSKRERRERALYSEDIY